jgi:hypothetical protein
MKYKSFYHLTRISLRRFNFPAKVNGIFSHTVKTSDCLTKLMEWLPIVHFRIAFVSRSSGILAYEGAGKKTRKLENQITR